MTFQALANLMLRSCSECCALDLPGFTTAMDGESAAIGKEPMRPTAMDGGSAGAAGSGSSKNLEGLHPGLFGSP